MASIALELMKNIRKTITTKINEKVKRNKTRIVTSLLNFEDCDNV